MLRLEARDVAKNEREKLDGAFETLAELVVAYGTRAATKPVDMVMAGMLESTTKRILVDDSMG